MRGAAGVLAAGLTVLSPLAARADPARIVAPPAYGAPDEGVFYEGLLGLFEGFGFDTDWVPDGSAIQVRLAVFAGGGWTVEESGVCQLGWPPALEVRFAGDPGGGWLSMDVGLEVIARLRFSIDTPFGLIEWEGDIPGVPNFDLRFAAEALFDPFAMPGAPGPAVVVEDDIPPAVLYQLDLTDALIPIPGISGGFELLAGGTLTSTFAGVRFDVESDVGAPLGSIETHEGSLVVPVPPASPLPLAARHHAQLGALGVLELTPAVFIEIFGSTWEMPIITIPVTLVDSTMPWDLGEDTASFPLPDIEVLVGGLDYGTLAPDEASQVPIELANVGQLDLEVVAVTRGEAFAVEPVELVVPPGGSAVVTVTAHHTVGLQEGALELRSNDPDEPVVELSLRATGEEIVVTPPADAGPGSDGGPPSGAGDSDGGCGCRAAGGPTHSRHLVLALTALLLVVRASRRKD